MPTCVTTEEEEEEEAGSSLFFGGAPGASSVLPRRLLELRVPSAEAQRILVTFRGISRCRYQKATTSHTPTVESTMQGVSQLVGSSSGERSCSETLRRYS